MKDERLREILEAFSNQKMGVLGDFFLDLYLDLDRSLSELSLETNLEAFQAVNVRPMPGAAGVVVNNLVDFGVNVTALAYIGDDGNGYELRKALEEKNVRVESLVVSKDRFTPTYIKPLMREVDGTQIELNRIDIKNRQKTPPALEDALIRTLQQEVGDLDGVLVLEQVDVDEHGVVTPRIRAELATMSQKYPRKIFGVDSRHFSAQYQGTYLKVNLAEAVRTANHVQAGTVEAVEGLDPLAAARHCQQILWDNQDRPVFITLGEEGISGIGEQGSFYHQAYPVTGPMDIVGAGDSVMAGIGASLCAGARPQEAAYIGNLVGSITIQSLGETGTARPEEIWARHQEYQVQIGKEQE